MHHYASVIMELSVWETSEMDKLSTSVFFWKKIDCISGFLRNKKGVFPFETNKTLCVGRFALTHLERYSITFKDIFHFFFFFLKNLFQPKQNNISTGGKLNKRMS